MHTLVYSNVYFTRSTCILSSVPYFFCPSPMSSFSSSLQPSKCPIMQRELGYGESFSSLPLPLRPRSFSPLFRSQFFLLTFLFARGRTLPVLLLFAPCEVSLPHFSRTLYTLSPRQSLSLHILLHHSLLSPLDCI